MTITSIATLVLSTVVATAAPEPIIRGIYADPAAAETHGTWAAYGSGYEFDSTVKHGGKTSIRCANATDGEARGAGQTVRFDQDKPRPLIVAGWAKLEGVTPSFRIPISWAMTRIWLNKSFSSVENRFLNLAMVS